MDRIEWYRHRITDTPICKELGLNLPNANPTYSFIFIRISMIKTQYNRKTFVVKQVRFFFFFFFLSISLLWPRWITALRSSFLPYKLGLISTLVRINEFRQYGKFLAWSKSLKNMVFLSSTLNLMLLFNFSCTCSFSTHLESYRNPY